jgi:ZIP family zinc transporter
MAGTFTWGMTGLGAAMIFFVKDINARVLATMLGFSAGIMMAASFFSLLMPSIEMAKHQGLPGWFPAIVGFLSGCFFLSLADHFLPHLHLDQPLEKAEGVKTHWKKTTLLVFAITLHNIPEGLALGVAIGAAAAQGGPEAMLAAMVLAIGIGIQDFPEGLAISAPLCASGFSKRKAFMVGQWSGIVEPLAAMVGAAAVMMVQSLLPYALAFAAGAMIFVTIEELIPESQSGDHGDIATLGFVVGFALMMFLDVALG